MRHTLRYVSATLDYALFDEVGAELQLYGVTQMQIGLVVYVIVDLPVDLCFHMGVLLSHGAVRSNHGCFIEYRGRVQGCYNSSM